MAFDGLSAGVYLKEPNLQFAVPQRCCCFNRINLLIEIEFAQRAGPGTYSRLAKKSTECERNKDQCYIAEWLLKEWAIP